MKMNFTKRALHSVKEYKKKNIIIFIIFLLSSLLLLGAWSMKNASRHAMDKISAALPAKVTVYKVGGGMSAYDKGSSFPLKCAEEIADQNWVLEKNYITKVNVYGEGVEGIIPDYERSQKNNPNFYSSEEEKNAGPLNLVGVPETEAYPNFTYIGDEITKGRGIRKEDAGKPYAVVSFRFLERNQLKPGDTFEVSSCFDRSQKIVLEIVGVHSGNYLSSKSLYSECNTIYTPLEAALGLNEEGILRAEYTIKNAAEIEKYAKEIRSLGKTYHTDFEILKDSIDYLNAINPLRGIEKVCDGLWFSVMLVMAFILALLGLFSILERKNEIGVLVSMGETRLKVWGQLFIEQLIPVLAGIVAGMIIWRGTCIDIGKALLANEELWRGVDFAFSWTGCLMLLGLGVGITLLALCVGAVYLYHYQPREMLQD